MRFLDASVFVHAYLRPRRALSPSDQKVKEGAKRIVARVNSGEKVMTSAVHLAEVANILEDYMPAEEALAVERAILFKENISVAPVSRQECLAALEEAKDAGLGLTDALACVLMREKGLEEIYSFDRDFDGRGGLKRVSG